MNRTKSRGVTSVEMAIVLPLLLLLVFGLIEYGWMFLKKQGLTNLSRQTARIAARYDATPVEVQTATDLAMASGGLTGYGVTVTMAPVDPLVLAPGETFTVTASVPYANIELMGLPFLPTPATLRSQVTMAKEGP